MKKIISIAFAAILVGLAISCQKEELVSDKTDAVQYTFNITVNEQVGFDNDTATKGGTSESHKTAWENGDRIFLFFKPTGGSLLGDRYATLTYNGSSWDGTVTTGQSSLEDGGTLSAVYVYKLDGSVTPAYSDSKWTIATGNTFYNCQTGVSYTVSGSEISATLNLEAPTNFVQFYVTGATGVLTCDKVKGWKDIAIGSDMAISNVTCTGYIDGFANSGDPNVKEYYGRIVDGTSLNGKACEFSVVKNGKVYERTATPTSDARSFKMIVSTPDWPEAAGKLPGLFTMGKGADGKAGTVDDVQVRFSKGNLYAKNNGSTWNWGFYDKQYQFNYLSMPVISISGGSRTAASSDTEIDLFCWGYSSNSTNYNEKSSNSSFTDWGSISGLPSAPGANWRTLSRDEWTHLLNNRTGISTVNGTANARYLKCMVKDVTVQDDSKKDVYGLLIFPDTFTWPTTVTAPDASYINKNDLAWDSVPGYNQTQFEALEGSGVVFLPAAGRRDETGVEKVGSSGHYWSSAAYLSSNAYYLGFDGSDVVPANSNYRGRGGSVRLVSVVQ